MLIDAFSIGGRIAQFSGTKFYILDKTIGMPTSTFEPTQPEVASQSLISLNSVVKHFQDGVSFVKEELMDMYDKAGESLSKLVLPVNNFLKDRTQIESELQLEYTKEHICGGQHGGYTGYLEENY